MICKLFWEHFYFCRDLYCTENENRQSKWIFELEMLTFEKLATEFLIYGHQTPGERVNISLRNIEAYYMPGFFEVNDDLFKGSDDMDDRRRLRANRYLKKTLFAFPEYENAVEYFEPFWDICYARENEGFRPTLAEMIHKNDHYIKNLQNVYQKTTGINLDID